MYCQSCGNPLPQKMKYCNRCGALVSTENTAVKRSTEKRLDSYLDGLFWVTVFGLAFVFGGLIVLKRFELATWIQLLYLSISATAFLINFGLNLMSTLRLMRGDKAIAQSEVVKTAELESTRAEALLNPAPVPASVTENTTRSFEPVYNKERGMKL
jgi:hypothetical protein